MARKKPAKNKKAEYSVSDNNSEIMSRNMDALMSSYNKMFNKDNPYCAMLASELAEMEMIQPVPTGHITFDLMTGIGGLPRGKIIEFTGEEGTHKSNMAWECVGNVHQSDPYSFCVWIDAEKALDVRVPEQRKHILNMHVDLSRLIICVPDTAEDCWKMVSTACDNNATLVVIDSISALIPQREFTADFDKDGYPALPASINKGFRKISTQLFMSGTTLIEINQVRENLSVAGQKYVAFEDRWKTTGGKGLKHWLTLRLFFRKKKIVQTVDEGIKQHIGDEVFVKVIKTRLAPIRDNAHLFMYHRIGFDRIEELITMAVDWGLLYKEKKTSRTFFWRDHEELEGCSWAEWYDYFKDDSDAFEHLTSELVEEYNAYYSEDAAIENEIANQLDEDDYGDE